jgi:SET domain-containing protein
MQRKLVEVGKSGIHGKGVFVVRAIPKNTRIIEYSGERISWDKAQNLPPNDPKNPHHTFFFSLDDGMVINAGVNGNEARWINHSCAPNCETRDYRGRIYVYALRNLKKGEELFYDYRLEPADRRTKALEKLFRCDCGSAACRGTMLEPLEK